MIDRIDINSDLGESWGAYTIGDDSSMLGIVTSANLACGFHGGDPDVMAKTVALAKKGGVGQPRRSAMTKALWHWMKETGDPELEKFQKQVELALD